MMKIKLNENWQTEILNYFLNLSAISLFKKTKTILHGRSVINFPSLQIIKQVQQTRIISCVSANSSMYKSPADGEGR